METKGQPIDYSLLEKFRESLVFDLFGPKLIQARILINLQKGGTFFFCLFLMWYYQNFSLGAYLYICLHGSYGMFWLLKDQAFPDKSFDNYMSVGSCIGVVFILCN